MNKLSALLSIIFFGAIGGLLRFVIGNDIPFWGTIIVNLSGCFLLGFLTSFLYEAHAAEWLSLGLRVGLIGSFTTFSSFCLDNIKLLLTKNLSVALIYLTLSILGGWIFTYLGITLENHVVRILQKGGEKNR